ncbi:DUF3592 domain-containing protein [Hymenobacter gummosus]|uniref:DUF3592 domain-containing protein n=1 Tax=Hymenobacter gummosus TaxID=1776032 RepID=A0A3S0H6Y0_9BACT|nr:DUF3592 domain-containing protein [Hymenobacter gummosus]RTQ46841.1 DUF3592 domain-containing protein [Hymenobacter gummosus]
MSPVPLPERLAFIGIGLALMGLGYSLRRQYRRLRRHGTLATGTVVDHDDAPVVQFGLPDGRLLKVKPAYGPSGHHRVLGEAVTLYYNPDDPQDFVLNTAEHAMMPHFYLLFGLLFVLGGLLAPLTD